MRVIEIRGNTPLEYARSMLQAKNAVLAAGYSGDGHPEDIESDVWDFNEPGKESLRVVWTDPPDGPDPHPLELTLLAATMGFSYTSE